MEEILQPPIDIIENLPFRVSYIQTALRTAVGLLSSTLGCPKVTDPQGTDEICPQATPLEACLLVYFKLNLPNLGAPARARRTSFLVANGVVACRVGLRRKKRKIGVGGIPNSKEVCTCKLAINYHLFFAQAVWQSTKVYFQHTKVYFQRTKVYFCNLKVYFRSTKLYILWKYKSILSKYKRCFRSTKI